MKLLRRTITPAEPELMGQSVRALLSPGCWGVQAGCTPPATHLPARLLAGIRAAHGMALSLNTPAVLALDVAGLVMGLLEEAGCDAGPLAMLALHEILVNAAVHGNLQVATGQAMAWSDLARREQLIGDGLADPQRASRLVTIALGWGSDQLFAVVADEGSGYTGAPPAEIGPKPHAAGRGLAMARLAANVDVLRGGSCTRLVFPLLGAKEAAGAS